MVITGMCPSTHTKRLLSQHLVLPALILLFSFSAVVAFAGTDALPIMRSAQTARALGMGGAHTAITTDVRWNPSGLARVQRTGVAFSNRVQTLDTQLFDLSFQMRATDELGLGSALAYYTVGGVPVISAQAQQTGELSEKQLAAHIGGGYQLQDISVGVTLTYASHQLTMPGAQVEGVGFGGNLGVLYRPSPAFRLGAVLRSQLALNWGDQHTDTSPFGMRVGVAYHSVIDLSSSLNLAADIEQTQGFPLKMHLGAELLLRDGPHAFAIRGGLRDVVLENRGSQVSSGILVSTNVKPGLGLGFRWNPPQSGSLRIDYALVLERLGIRHILTLAYDF